MKQVIISLLLCAMLMQPLYAQLRGQHHFDSLQKELLKTQQDSNRIKILGLLSSIASDVDPAKGIEFGKEALKLCRELKWENGFTNAYYGLGINYWARAEYESALLNFNLALKHCDTKRHQYQKSKILTGMGLVYHNQGKLPKALEYYLLSLKIDEERRDKPLAEAKTLSNISMVYFDMADYQKSIEYNRKALLIYQQEKDKYGMADVLSTAGAIYSVTGDYVNGLKCETEALKLFEEMDNQSGIATALSNIGGIYNYNHDFSKAVEYSLKAIHILEASGDLYNVALNLGNVGIVYLDVAKNIDSAKQEGYIPKGRNANLVKSVSYLNKAINLSKEMGDMKQLQQFCAYLSDAYEMQGNYEKALSAYKQYSAYNDSVYSIENKKIVNNLEHQRELDLKESKIKILELKAQKEKTTRRMMIGGTTLVIIIACMMILYFIKRAKTEKLIANEKINTLLKDQELKSVSDMLDVQDSERKRIATDLHDRLGSMLSTVKLYFGSVEEQIDKLKEQNKEQYHKATTLLDEACDEVRKISHDLVSGALVKFGLVSALQQLTKTIEETGQFKIKLLAFGMDDRLDGSVEIALYRIIQELMNNIMKHSKATAVTIQLNRVDNDLNIVVEDNGIGFDINYARAKGGLGLQSITSRVSKLNGKIQFDSGRGKGTTTIIDITV